MSVLGEVECDFALEQDNKLYYKYENKECDFEVCVFYKNRGGSITENE